MNGDAIFVTMTNVVQIIVQLPNQDKPNVAIVIVARILLITQRTEIYVANVRVVYTTGPAFPAVRA